MYEKLLLNLMALSKSVLILNLPIFKFSSFDTLVGALIDLFLWFGSALSVIAIIYSGIMYITAGGIPGTEDKPKGAMVAKKNLIWAITGLIIFLLARQILAWTVELLNWPL